MPARPDWLPDVPQAERVPRRDWSLAMLSALEPAPGVAVLERGHAAVRAFLALLGSLVQRRRAAPGDGEPERDPRMRLRGFRRLPVRW